MGRSFRMIWWQQGATQHVQLSVVLGRLRRTRGAGTALRVPNRVPEAAPVAAGQVPRPDRRAAFPSAPPGSSFAVRHRCRIRATRSAARHARQEVLMPVVLGLVLLLAAAAEPSTSGSVGYYRFPAIHGDTIVFGAEGDLWQVSRNGGVAARLTSHPADEAFPVISPDGTTLAFSAAYEGPTEVYTMPLAGGPPVRRTFDGGRSAGGGLRSATARSSTRRGGTARCPTRSSSGWTSAPASARRCRSPRRRTGTGRPTGARSSSPGSRSRAATRSVTAAAPRRVSGSTWRERRRRCRSPPTTRGRARRRCGGAAASTS